MPVGPIWFALACLSSYLFFCAVAADPKGRATVYVGSPLHGWQHAEENVSDPIFKFFTGGAAFWSSLLIILITYNKGHCSLHPTSWYEVPLGVLTIYMAGKILFGPIMEIRKSIRLVDDRKFEQPYSFIVYDAIKIWPSNFITQIFWKWTMAWIVMIAFIEIFNFSFAKITGIYLRQSEGVVPLPLALAWLVACIGRTSGFIISQKIPHHLQLIIYGITVAVALVMWSLAEAMLKGCGAQQGVLPAYKSLVAGIVASPLIETVITLVAAIF